MGEGNNKHNDDGDGLLSFFISNDFPIVFFSVHALSLFGVFVHAADPFPHLFFLYFCLFEDVSRGFTVLLVPYCLVQGVVFSCFGSA